MYLNTKSSVFGRLFFSALVFISTVFYLAHGISNYFTGSGITDAVIFHLKYGLRGAGFLEYWELIAVTVLIIISILFLYWVFLEKLKTKTERKIYYIYPAFLFLFLSLFSNPASSELQDVLLRVYIANQLKENKPNVTDFYKYYKKPYIKQVGDSKNLVVIYAEGLERTYFDENLFPGLIKRLRELQSKSTYFTNIKQVTGTEWTIGGMVAGQCGLPLFISADGNSMSGIDKFLSSAVCLGDLLHKEDYYLVYYGGANLSFAGKGKFYSTHKFDEIYGKKELVPKLENKSYKSGWGLFDDSLFDLVYQRFLKLSETRDKFALFLLSLDTHYPKGNPSRDCQNIIYKDGSNPILNAVACSDYLITELANKIMKSPYGSETIIVIVSDHLALRNDVTSLLNKKSRNNLLMILEPGADKSTEIEKLGSTIDLGTTIMPFIGYEGVVGLGRNLIDKDLSELEIRHIHESLLAWQPSISLFWSFPKIQDYIEIDITSETMEIDGRIFDIPVLIKLNTELETNLAFFLNLDKYVLDLEKNTPFLLIDRCARAGRLDKKLRQSGFCLIAGQGSKYYKSIELENNLRLIVKDIKQYTGLK